MIVRIVKMKFLEEKVEDFKQLFEERKERIRAFDGCIYLELWQTTGKPNEFFTYSHWENEAALNHYRFSDFFKDTWGKTKALFEEKAQAWSVNQVHVLP